MTHCSTQLDFPFFKDARLTATPDGGSIVSDAGLLLVREFDEKIGLTRAISDVIYDPRDPRFVVHPQIDLLRQRIYQIVAGYEDCNDATRLRHDPIFKAVAGRTPEDVPLGSQPTLSRLENRVGLDTQMEAVDVLVRRFIATRPEPLEEITLDIDPSEAETYGQQELTFFNAHYDSYMYFPQFICDAKTRFLLAAVLRPGNVGTVQGAILLLDRIVRLLRHAWPDLKIRVRGDSNFADPALLNWLEEQEIPYTIGMAGNKALAALSAPFVKTVEERFRTSSQPQRSFTSIRYRTQKTWSRKRRIVVKVEVTSLGTNVRYVIATQPGRSRNLYEWYVERGGTIEDALEQLKNGFEGDRLSCRDFKANAFRLIVHAAAYNLMLLFREHVAVPELADADIQTVRVKLIKVGALIVRTARRLWVKLSSTWPFLDLFKKVHAVLVPAPSG